MSDDLQLPGDCFVAPSGAPSVGDVCAAVPLPVVGPDAEIFESDGLPHRFGVDATLVYALVLRVFEGYAVVAPVTTADVASDRGNFSALVDSGADAPRWVSVPPLEGAWSEDAVVLLFMPHTVHADVLDPLQIASMSPEGREVLGRRVVRAFQA